MNKKMKKAYRSDTFMRTSSLIMSIFAFCALPSIRADDSDFLRLKKQRQAAIESALAPINKVYKEKLEELLKQYTAKQDLDSAIKVKAEVDELNSSKIQGNDEDPAAKKRSLERRLINSKWSFPAATEAKNKQYIEFKPDGLLIVGWAAKQGLFHWSVSDQDRSVIVRPYNGQEASETIVFDEGFKKGTIKYGKGDVETIPFR